MRWGSYFVYITFGLLCLIAFSVFSSASTPGDINACQTLDTAGTYTLTTDLGDSGRLASTCFTISANGVILDGQGHTLYGLNSGSTYGVHSDTRTNVTIKNIKTDGFVRGISFRSNNVNSLVQNVVLFNNTYGLYLAGLFFGNAPNGNRFVNLTANNNSYGIYVDTDCSNNSFTNISTSYNAQAGTQIWFSFNNSFSALNSYKDSDVVVVWGGDSNNNTFSNFVINSPTNKGFWFRSGSFNTLQNSIINGTGREPLYFDNSPTSNNTIKNVSITNTAGTFSDINFVTAGINDTNIIDSPIRNYSIVSPGIWGFRYALSNYGAVIFISNISGSGTEMNSDINISSNFISINSSKTALNRSLQISLYNLRTNFVIPRVYWKARECNSTTVPVCNNLTSLNAGNITLSATNSGNYTVVETFSESNSPNVTLNSPEDAFRTSNRTVKLNASFADDFALSNVTLYVWNSNGTIINQSLFNMTGTLNNTAVELTLPYDGMFYWNYKATDSYNNSAFNSTNFSLLVDTTPPVISITSPTATTYESEIVSINVVINENGSCYYLKGNSLVNNSMVSSDYLHFSSSWSLDDGDYSVHVFCNDTLNNLNNASSSFSVRIPSSLRRDRSLLQVAPITDKTDKRSASCTPGWNCSEWNDCVEGSQKRKCINSCSEVKFETKECEEVNLTQDDSGWQNLDKNSFYSLAGKSIIGRIAIIVFVVSLIGLILLRVVKKSKKK